MESTNERIGKRNKNEEMKRIHAFVSGRVQGVFFRANTKEKADELNCKGFAKNLMDGRVEVIAEGKKENLEKLLEFLKKGPENAKVDNLDFEWKPIKNEFTDFSQY